VLDRLRRRCGAVALAGIGAFFALVGAVLAAGLEPPDVFADLRLHWAPVALSAIEGMLAVAASVWLLGTAQRRLARPRPRAVVRSAYRLQRPPLTRCQRDRRERFAARGREILRTLLGGAPFAIPRHRVAGTVTLDERGCSYRGATRLTAGEILFDTVNRTASPMHFIAGRLDPQHTVRDLERFAETVTEDTEAPPWFTPDEAVWNPPRSQMTWRVNLRADTTGETVLACATMAPPRVGRHQLPRLRGAVPGHGRLNVSGRKVRADPRATAARLRRRGRR
jgi:hypothetical protein